MLFFKEGKPARDESETEERASTDGRVRPTEPTATGNISCFI